MLQTLEQNRTFLYSAKIEHIKYKGPCKGHEYFHKPAENRRVPCCDLLLMESSLCYYLLSQSLDFQGSAVAFSYT